MKVEVDSNSKKVECKYCGIIFSGEIYRLKHCFARTSLNVEPCSKVPEEVKKFFLEIFWGKKWGTLCKVCGVKNFEIVTLKFEICHSVMYL